jgi:hypothetical protein
MIFLQILLQIGQLGFDLDIPYGEETVAEQLDIH